MLVRRLLCGAGLLFATGAFAGPNLVVNGSFEQGPGGLGSFAGWTTVLGDASTFVDSSGTTGTRYGQATDGLWAAYFGSTAADGGASIAQTLATVIGQRYELGFDVANDNGGAAPANRFGASVGGVPLYAFANGRDADFVHVVVPFFATATTTAIRFAASNDQGYVELDRVGVAAVPEPDTMALASTGGLMLLGIGRRRGRAGASTLRLRR